MLRARGTSRRPALSVWAVGLLLLMLGACRQEPPPDLTYARLGVSGEVFRIFCRRVARDAHPDEPSGDRFYPLCDGEATPRGDEDPRLVALLARRPQIVAALERVFGEEQGVGIERFEEDELSGFLRSLVPLYDAPEEVVPSATRALADVLGRLSDPDDTRARRVVETVARLSKRVGYRAAQDAIGAVRALLTYPEIDPLARELLAAVAEGGPAHSPFTHALEVGALELASDAEPARDRDTSTLHVLLELLLQEASVEGATGPALVLARDAEGNALAKSRVAAAPSPFPVPGREDDAARDPTRAGLALGRDGSPLYESLDASRTVLAAVMREAGALFARGDAPRGALENVAHGVRPLLGPWRAQTATFGRARYAFEGPDVAEAPLLDLVHALSTLARYPETESLLRVLAQVIEKDESAAMALVYAGLRIDELADRHPSAALVGVDGPGSPHELWDDLIAVGQRIAARPGMIESLVRAFTDPRSGMQGKLLARWMRHRDAISYPNSPSTTPADVNGVVRHALREPVDRTQPDVGMNRSIWQRTLSLIHAFNGTRICNKDKAVLTVTTNGLGKLTFPSGYPNRTDGYKECALIELPSAIEIYMRAMLGVARLNIKDEGAKLLAALGSALGITGSVGQIQEKESQITGFTDKPTPQALARFVFAPRNRFLKDMFDPAQTADGVEMAAYEPNGLFAVENLDDGVMLDGKPQSFLTLGAPLVEAFDRNELRDGDVLRDGYTFGIFLSALHKHWPAPKSEPCPATPQKGREGCTQRLDPSAPFYAPQTNLVSYEPLIASALDDEDLTGRLQRAASALGALQVDGKDGLTILAQFARRVLTPDPLLQKRDGRAYTTTNTCFEVAGAGGERACKDGRGRIIPALTPLHLVLDALRRFDEAFAAPAAAERRAAWLAGRSQLVDRFLTVSHRDASSFALDNRRARALVLALVPWVADRIAAHRASGDLEPWVAGLAPRLEKVLSHPLAASGIALLDALWELPEASRELSEVGGYLLDEARDPGAFRGLLVAVTDLLILLDRDPDLTPAIQFAALALAPNAFDALDGNEDPDVRAGAVASLVALTHKVVAADTRDESTLSKLLRNVVHAGAGERTPLETLLEAAADVNRAEVELPSEEPLSVDESRFAFRRVQGFFADEERGLERLYQVIQGRQVDR